VRIQSKAGSHLVDGVWVVPEDSTEIPDADWPKFSGLPGVFQVLPEPATTATAATLDTINSELLVVTAELQALQANAAAAPGSPETPVT
jgi:hypothetical protein